MKTIEVEAQFIFTGKISITIEDDECEWTAKDRITDGFIWMTAPSNDSPNDCICCEDENIDWEFDNNAELQLYEVL